MKLFTINPLYTSLFSVIIFAALTYSFSLYTINGKTYLDSDYEIVFGGHKTLKTRLKLIRTHSTYMKRIGRSSFTGLKSYRKLTVDEQLKVQKIKKKRDVQREKERKERDEEKEKERKHREAVREKEFEQREKERQMREVKREKDLQQREMERRQREAERENYRQQREMERRQRYEEKDRERLARDAVKEKEWEQREAARFRYSRGFDAERETGMYNVKWKYR